MAQRARYLRSPAALTALAAARAVTALLAAAPAARADGAINPYGAALKRRSRHAERGRRHTRPVDRSTPTPAAG